MLYIPGLAPQSICNKMRSIVILSTKAQIPNRALVSVNNWMINFTCVYFPFTIYTKMFSNLFPKLW